MSVLRCCSTRVDFVQVSSLSLLLMRWMSGILD